MDDVMLHAEVCQVEEMSQAVFRCPSCYQLLAIGDHYVSVQLLEIEGGMLPGSGVLGQSDEEVSECQCGRLVRCPLFFQSCGEAEEACQSLVGLEYQEIINRLVTHPNGSSYLGQALLRHRVAH